MQHAQKFLLVAATTLAVVFGCASVQKISNMADAKQNPAWAKIDSLDNLGQYKSALEATEAVLASARAGHDWRTEFRAWMYKGRFMQFTGSYRGNHFHRRMSREHKESYFYPR